jgi:hypothetical protein
MRALSTSGNASSSRRAAISIHYAGSDARWDPRPNVMKIEGEPENTLRAGDPLVLDAVFPIAWERARAQVINDSLKREPKTGRAPSFPSV